MFKTFLLKDLKTVDAQHFLQTAIAPRPICFASTIDIEGNVNLSPFSFFNMFSTNPPIVIFSPARRVRNNTTKHSLENILEVPEVVINIVDYSMLHQTSLASCEYPKGTDEFEKAGFTKETSQLVKPPRVKESPVQLECKVIEVKSLGTEGGAGNLIIAEILMMHINEDILGDDGKIDQLKIHQAARLGGNWYTKMDSSNLFEIEKPNTLLGIGIDQLPKSIRFSKILTGSHLGQLANIHEPAIIEPSFDDKKLKSIFEYFSLNPEEMEIELHLYAAELLNEGKVNDAWQVLLAMV